MDSNQLEFLEHISGLNTQNGSQVKALVNNNKITPKSSLIPNRHNPRACSYIIDGTVGSPKDLFDLLNGNFGDKVGDSHFFMSKENIRNILNNTSWGKDFVFRNFTNIIIANDENIYVILEYLFKDFDNNIDFIKKISIYKDMHIRYIFMKYLIENRPDKVEFIYDDIIKYLVDYTYQENEQLSFMPVMMEGKDISDLAVTILNSKVDKMIWYRLKEYILANYKYNELGALLLGFKDKKQVNKDEFAIDANRLFSTSNGYQFYIYRDYSGSISQELVSDFERYLNYFNRGSRDMDYALHKVFMYDLWDELKDYVDKYLSLSKSVDFRFLAEGSTTSCYKIGDYVFKLNKHKWSSEDVICPNLYLILKNLEEHYVRDGAGTVRCGIEVQKYLSRRDIRITPEYLKWFSSELERLGYYTEDTLIGGTRGDNCMLLDSYMDADHPDPDSLPDVFKETPFVIVDRDLIYSVKSRRKRCKLIWE